MEVFFVEEIVYNVKLFKDEIRVVGMNGLMVIMFLGKEFDGDEIF